LLGLSGLIGLAGLANRFRKPEEPTYDREPNEESRSGSRY
jgi:hypothetical protein